MCRAEVQVCVVRRKEGGGARGVPMSLHGALA